MMLVPALIVLLLVLPTAPRDHLGRFDWPTPPMLRAAECLVIVAVGIAAGAPKWLLFVQVYVGGYQTYDTVYRPGQRIWPPAEVAAVRAGVRGRLPHLRHRLPHPSEHLAAGLGVLRRPRLGAAAAHRRRGRGAGPGHAGARGADGLPVRAVRRRERDELGPPRQGVGPGGRRRRAGPGAVPRGRDGAGRRRGGESLNLLLTREAGPWFGPASRVFPRRPVEARPGAAAGDVRGRRGYGVPPSDAESALS